MDLKVLLQNSISTKKLENNPEESEKSEDEYFQKIYQQWKGIKAKNDDSTYKVIPKFYFKLPKEDEILPQKLREETRALFLQRRSRQLLDNNELKALWVLLDKHHSPPLSGDEQLINYEDFKKVGKLAGTKCSPYFTAVVFAKLQQGDPHGRISIMALFNYVMRKVWLHQTRIGLEKSFHSFYVCTAVRKFLFFLDPLRTGRVRIQDILACSFLDDLLELRDEDLPKDLQEANWFSAPSALKVYGQYLNLDRDHNGMLNKEELAGYGTGTLTGVFLERVFQECLTYEGEMDYKTYLDFVLALENRHEPQSLHYLFRILDINNRGYLDTFCLNYFFRAIQEQMTMHGQEPVSFEDVKDEIFDMVKPADPCKITLQDLLSCGQGDTMVSILIEFHGFWAYENREAMAADTGDESSHSLASETNVTNELNKENSEEFAACNARSKLQRLGKLYSESKAERIQAKFNEQVKAASEPQPSTSRDSRWIDNQKKQKDPSPARHLKWDKNVLDSLESNAAASRLSPNKFTRQAEGKRQVSPSKSVESPKGKKIGDNASGSPTSSSKSSDSKCSSTPERVTKSANTTSSSRLPSRTGFNGSPKTLVQPSGSVLSKASMFEAKNADTKVKDPAQTSLAERMAFFERNKGQAPLIPKAPLTMSIPPKKLQEKDNAHPDSSPLNNRNVEAASKTVVEQRAIFEQGNNRNKVEEMENHILQATGAERQRELDMLRARFNVNKDIARAAAGSCVRTSESSEGGGKSASPKSSLVCPVKPTPAPRIRVCAPKPGSLYPNLSEIEVTESESDTEYTVGSTEAVTATLDERSDTETGTEAEYYVQDETDDETESEWENIQNVCIGRTSLGRVIMHELNERSLFNKKRSIEPDPDSSTTTDISVLDEMDQFLDDCLEMQEETDVREEGPTPPKVNKSGKSPMAAYNFKSPLKMTSPSKKTERIPYVESSGRHVPLLRTVSSYRRQQSELKARSTARPATGADPSFSEQKPTRENETILVESKVRLLLDEVCTQQKKIEGASKALNLCHSTVEFNGSSEHVGGEWALLVATHKRQAALNEVQRLKREGTLRPVKAGSSEVVATQAATAEPGDSCIRFTSTLKLDDLHSDFKIDVEVYCLETQPKYLPHEKKYHINHNGAKAVNKTPKKKNQFVMPEIQSPAGPNVIRSPAFQLCGSTAITLNDINREQFTLRGISPYTPLEGHLRMRMSQKLAVSVEHRGFLTIFEDISKLGFWHRRWCVLRDAKLYYWVHPEDEHEKNPVGHLDLEGVFTKNVQFVNREKCARPFTFLLETTRAAQPGDADGLIVKTNGIQTTIEHFLLADTREEGLQWMSKFNKTLSLIRAWGPFRDPA
ncbi:hypothetical protein DMN91_001205 [Ooceraea biroi]|uniref:PH domain-containing protein n=1 Tax=Ooceraea biroi TaxID=2015173 RepID=A0A3L8E3Y0_OOCBI|nr:hypothetical protein DMN91_001205 [Ooceraea biroi]